MSCSKVLLLSLSLLLAVVIPAAPSTLFSGFPYLGMTVDTGILGGGFIIGKYQAPVVDSSSTSATYQVMAAATYTQKGQFLVYLFPEYSTAAWVSDTGMVLKLWPDTFYGIGNDTAVSAAEKFTEEIYGLSHTWRLQVRDSWFVSHVWSGYFARLTDIKPGGMIDQALVPGIDPGMINGTGVSIRWNTAGFGFYPERGIDLTGKYMLYRSWLGSDHSYDHYRLDCKAYIPIGSKTVLALRTDLVMNHGDVPLLMMPGLGDRLRAYPERRFIDKNRISQNIEQRVFPFDEPFLDRIGFVFFVEAGQVLSGLDGIDPKDWHWSAGVGLRFAIIPQERLNVRLDLGFGADKPTLSVMAREFF